MKGRLIIGKRGLGCWKVAVAVAATQVVGLLRRNSTGGVRILARPEEVVSSQRDFT